MPLHPYSVQTCNSILYANWNKTLYLCPWTTSIPWLFKWNIREIHFFCTFLNILALRNICLLSCVNLINYLKDLLECFVLCTESVLLHRQSNHLTISEMSHFPSSLLQEVITTWLPVCTSNQLSGNIKPAGECVIALLHAIHVWCLDNASLFFNIAWFVRYKWNDITHAFTGCKCLQEYIHAWLAY